VSGELIVSLDEFAELAGVTAETMRVHLRELLKDGTPQPAWLIERGERGRAYKIEAEGGIGWWQAKRDADDQADEARRAQLQQMRLELVGDTAEQAEALSLSGRQRREEYGAALEAIKYRKLLKQLVDTAELERVLSHIAVDHRRRLQRIPAEFGIAVGLTAEQQRQLEGMIERSVDAFVAAICAPGAFDGEG
jgi:predicted ArsR family transcriptional regulator